MDTKEISKQEKMDALIDRMKKDITVMKRDMADIENRVNALTGLESYESADMLLLGTFLYLSKVIPDLSRDLSSSVDAGYSIIHQSLGFQRCDDNDVCF